MDLAYPSNRFILIATPVIGSIFGAVALLRSETFGDAVGWGFSSGGAAFLAWTIARELHPDRIWVATVATLVAPLGVLLVRPDLWAAAVVLLVTRAVAGTTGRGMRVADVALLGTVAAIAATRDAGPFVVGVGVVGLLLVARWSERGRRNALAAAGLYVVAATISAFFSGISSVSTEGWIVLGVGVALGVIAASGPRRVSIGTDRPGGTIDPGRVRAARLIALLSAGLATVAVDPATLLPVWVALGATALRPS
jgi:hypothetical protein